MKNAAKLILMLALVAAAVAALALYLGSSGEREAATASPLVISEVMTGNKGSVPDEFGDYPDWIELYNDSDSELDIGGAGITDELTSGAKYVFPAGTKLAPRGYILVWCSGTASGPLYAPFKLNSEESVILFSSSGSTLDTLVLRAVSAGASLARTQSGAWEEAAPSPGFPNTAEGAAQYEATLVQSEVTGVCINEFMASNATVLPDFYGEYSDWIELYNSTDKDFDLSGLGLSDDISQPKKYTFPDGALIPAGGYVVVFCSGNTGFAENGELHAPFSLKAYGEDVVLTSRMGTVIDSFSYASQEKDASMARMPDGTGEFASSTHPTPGYSNDDAGYAAFIEGSEILLGDVFISEVTGGNVSLLAAADGGFYDLIELANAGGEAFSLAGCALSDNPSNPAKWRFPDSATIPAGGCLVVYASGLGAAAQGEIHASFGISGEGEGLYFFDPGGRLIDKLQAPAALCDISYGRDASGQLAYFDSPTFGAKNGSGYAGVTSSPEFLTAPGVYSGPVEITLSAAEGERIFYTLDCTVPTAASSEYTGPIRAEKNTVVRAIALRDGYLDGAGVAGTFLFESDGVDHSVKIATLVTNPDGLWSSATGIYAYGDQYDPTLPYGDALNTAQFYLSKQDQEKWEREANFSVFDESGTVAFSQNVGIRIAGSFGRGRAQKGINIFARDEYGPDRMAYPFFDSLPYGEYKALVLRAGGQDTNLGKFRDELAAGLLEGSDVNFLYQTYEPYVLYLNGEYWGLYFLKEKRNRFFVAQHEGTEDNVNLDIIRSEGSTGIYYGSNAEWKELMSYVRSHDLSDASAYAYVAERVDLDSFRDYMICEIYSANSDVWNIQFYKTDGGKWKWIYYDFCWSFGATYNPDTRDRADHQTVSIRRLSSKPCSDLFNALLAVPEWRDSFLRRFGELLSTIYAPEAVLAKIDELFAISDGEMAREREKFCGEMWMGVKQPAECRGTYESFLKQVEYMRHFAENRPASLIEQLRREFSLSDSYIEEVFG